MDDEGLESLLRLQDGTVPRLGFRTGVMMQFVNGKDWALVITIMRQALDGFGGGLTGIMLIASLTCTGGVAAMAMWSVGGGRLTEVLRDDVRGRRVLVALGTLVLLLLVALGLRGS
jgi:threonine/homoserine/homoserine lactone efflux protein